MSETLSLVDFVVWENPMEANNGFGRAKEKVIHYTKLSMEAIDLTVDGNGYTVQDETVAKESYKTKLMGVSLKLDVNVSMKEDFVLEAEDVATEMNYWTYDSIDAHTDTAVRERFSRLDVSVDLKKPLI
ncbi:hypothetical protein Golax_009424 [Gossypium laxum]|uniref:Uncharacterized protein n=1 Tax=Gossypium laxum TaxID=34288 RepID=A0A7J9AEM0_9ROSI|nr:hypothetical protein [Gossypium laxum]